MPVRTWSPGAAAVLSFFIPGLGHLYKGRIGTGIVLFVLTIGGYFVLVVPGIVIHLFAIYDAYNGKSKDEEKAASATAGRAITVEQRAAIDANARQNNIRIVIILCALFGAGLLIVTIGNIIENRRPVSDISEGPSGGRPSPYVTEEERWSQQLHKIATAAGVPCSAVATTFHQGARDRDNYWSIRCQSGETYAVILKAGRAAPQVLDCQTLKRVARVECFDTL